VKSCLQQGSLQDHFTGQGGHRYAVVTLHRPSNVDRKETFMGILEALGRISEDMPVIFPAHPRTRKNIEEFDLLKLVNGSNIELLPPMAYVPFLKLWKDAGHVARRTLEAMKPEIQTGVTWHDVIEKAETYIVRHGGKPAFPVTIAVNDLAAHYTTDHLLTAPDGWDQENILAHKD